jgi:hypothetical protein
MGHQQGECQLVLMCYLHGAQTLGGVYRKQWEHRRDEAPYSPRPEELPSGFLGPRCHRPDEPYSDKTDAPNLSVGVPKLQTGSPAEYLTGTDNEGRI